jgi:hypothetical protein
MLVMLVLPAVYGIMEDIGFVKLNKKEEIPRPQPV